MFDVFWTETIRSMMPWAEIFFRVITELGSEYFFVALIAIGYWAVDKKASIIMTIVLLISSITNYWLKISIKNPRPPVSNWLKGATASNYSLPSAHAQNSVTFWGWLGIKIRTWWMSVLSIFITIGLSRIYIGVHWLGDVLLGWGIGLVLLLLLWKLEDPINIKLSKYNQNILYLAIAIIGFFGLILTELLSPVTISGLVDNFGANGGLLIGLGIGLFLENNFVKFRILGIAPSRLIFRTFFGLLFLFLIMFVLAPILNNDIYWLRAIRYTTVTIAAIFVWPLLFKKIRL
jgi:membrane-associated phospholipid phosphatase